MQFTVEIAAIWSLHNFQRVMDFFQPISLPCSYLLEDSKWILFTVITVLTATHLQCIRLMLTRYPTDAGNVYSLFRRLPTPFCVVSILFSEPKGEAAKPSNTSGVFFSSSSFFFDAMGFFLNGDPLFLDFSAPGFTWHYYKCSALLKCFPPLTAYMAFVSLNCYIIWFLMIKIHTNKGHIARHGSYISL